MEEPARRREFVNRKGLIVAAALDVFAEVGFQKASMREIANRAGMTQAAIYYHFSDKTALLMNIISAFSEDLIARLDAVLQTPGEPKSKLGKLIYEQLDLVGTRKNELKILMEDKVHLAESDRAEIKLFERKIFRIYKTCLDQMKEEGDLNDINSVVAAFGILGSINWVYHWYREDGDVSFDEVKDSILTFALSGCCKSAKFAAKLREAV